jgi:hypothetical protein
VGQVEDAAFAVVELSGEQEQAREDEADVPRAEHEPHAGPEPHRLGQALEELLGRGEMFDHVEEST